MDTVYLEWSKVDEAIWTMCVPYRDWETVGVLGKTGGVLGRFENGQRERAVKVAIFYNPCLVYDT